MRANRLVFWLSAVVFLLPLMHAHAADTGDIEDTVRRSFDVEPGGTLYIDADRGNTVVRTGRGNRVEIVVERDVVGRSEAEAKEIWERHTLNITQSGSSVRIQSSFNESSGMWKRWRGRDEVRIEFTIVVPEQYNVRFETAAGNISVEGVAGAVTGRTGAGNLSFEDIAGSLDISSGSGNIRVYDIRGSARVRTGAGNVEAQDVQGRTSLETGAGNVEAVFSRQPTGDVTLNSGAGNVTARVAQGVGMDVDATTGMGSASAAFGLNVKGSFMSKSFAGPIEGGGPELRLRSGVGNVRLTQQ